MEEIVYKELLVGRKRLRKGWHFQKVYPSLLNDKTGGEKMEIWVSDERLKVPVGKVKVSIKFFLWLDYVEKNKTYDCHFGIVPDYKGLDDKVVEILKVSTRNRFFKNPYYYMIVDQKEYREIFLVERGVTEERKEEVREEMELVANIVEKNLLYFLRGKISDEGNKKSSGWSVLVRARSGSI